MMFVTADKARYNSNRVIRRYISDSINKAVSKGHLKTVLEQSDSFFGESDHRIAYAYFELFKNLESPDKIKNNPFYLVFEELKDQYKYQITYKKLTRRVIINWEG